MKYQGGKKYKIKGEIVTLYSIWNLVKILKEHGFDRTTQTIRKWELKGITPPAKFRVRGYRYYSEEEVTAFIRAMKESGIQKGVSIASTDFQELIFRYLEEAREEDKYDEES